MSWNPNDRDKHSESNVNSLFKRRFPRYRSPGESWYLPIWGIFDAWPEKITSGYRTRRCRSHCLKFLLIAATEKDFGFRRIILRNRGDFKDQPF